MQTYFLSYSRADSAVALRFADELIASGRAVWVDQYDIRPGQPWDHTVETALRGSQGVLVMLSPRSAASPNVADEIAVALDGGKAVIPILLEPCTPPLRLSRTQFIDATDDVSEALRRCVAHMDSLEGPDATPEVARPAPPVPAQAALPSILPRAVLAQAQRRLTGIMGPISATMVAGAARTAQSEEQLYRALAQGIADVAQRQAFLGWLGGPAARAPAAAGLPPAERGKLVRALARHLGPIAATLVEREFVAGMSSDELVQRLASRIALEKDRAAFIREATHMGS